WPSDNTPIPSKPTMAGSSDRNCSLAKCSPSAIILSTFSKATAFTSISTSSCLGMGSGNSSYFGISPNLCNAAAFIVKSLLSKLNTVQFNTVQCKWSVLYCQEICKKIHFTLYSRPHGNMRPQWREHHHGFK